MDIRLTCLDVARLLGINRLAVAELARSGAIPTVAGSPVGPGPRNGYVLDLRSILAIGVIKTLVKQGISRETIRQLIRPLFDLSSSQLCEQLAAGNDLLIGSIDYPGRLVSERHMLRQVGGAGLAIAFDLGAAYRRVAGAINTGSSCVAQREAVGHG